jgi:hypothetical protein
MEIQIPRKGRGGRRPGAGRKPTYLKRPEIAPIAAAEILARRHPQSASLSPGELEALHAITRKLAAPSTDSPGNQFERQAVGHNCSQHVRAKLVPFWFATDAG